MASDGERSLQEGDWFAVLEPRPPKSSLGGVDPKYLKPKWEVWDTNTDSGSLFLRTKADVDDLIRLLQTAREDLDDDW